jgi:hypothetical protein
MILLIVSFLLARLLHHCIIHVHMNVLDFHKTNLKSFSAWKSCVWKPQIERVGITIKHCPHIRDALGSNLSRDTGHSCVSPVTPRKCVNSSQIRPRLLHSKFYPPTIRRCIAEFCNLFKLTAHRTRRQNCRGTPSLFLRRDFSLKS